LGFLNLRRDTVEKEALYVALGLDEEGRKETLGFWIHPKESLELAKGLRRVYKARSEAERTSSEELTQES